MFKAGDRLLLNVPKIIRPDFLNDLNHICDHRWFDWIKDNNRSYVDLLRWKQVLLPTSYSLDVWYIHTDVTSLSLDPKRDWVPEMWLSSATLSSVLTKSNTLAGASVIIPKTDVIKKECNCSARDLFTVGHKCGRLAPIDKR